jgi:L-asparaginase / beta-aspartyl-peptidase
MWAIGIHGGAGASLESAVAAECRVLEDALSWAQRELERDARAIDVVEGAIRILEDSGRFVAGKGSAPNSAGVWELDASICDGRSRRAGAVAALRGVYPPISIARAVMERTKNILLVGDGAYDFARECGFEPIADPSRFFTRRGKPKASAEGTNHGTVGAVVLDSTGGIVAGTSTGGISGKRPGRVGDSPIIGAGTWADEGVGVSCTGEGEFFLRTAAAHSVSVHCRLGGVGIGPAIATVLAEIGQLGGRGGLIAVDRAGNVDYAFNADAMRIAVATSSGHREARVARAADMRS